MDVISLDLGTRHVPYHDAWERQRSIHAEVVAGSRPDTLILVEHPSVYTAGKRTSVRERPQDGTEVVDVDRGGRITWHGPGQLVVYPIIKLAEPVDVVEYVRLLEQAVIAVCDNIGVTTEQVLGRSGVWVPAKNELPERKICAIGVRVAQGVTMHGIALNCNPTLEEFDKIIPCGIDDAGVTSLSQEMGKNVEVTEVAQAVVDNLETALAQIRWYNRKKETL